ncbi:lipoprotein [Bordetella pertussis]|uniref:Exported protein n=3 Tax=Bordetella pertussis TaxID=520 RepID=Q7VS05_BORPE|nr:tripartite tricarboxylate transporter substrate binding protein [Bordetella pertussis]ETH38481.1 tripartite tricarboxylate transporter family receptor [Bordetella pertussis H918]ETH43708.1 tripartite tricarboxylate transporter family receptor [Bordetella pertussis H939]ETH46022.1 tripartite tricarboxylate transporter family receptor [Bordetella pertussis H921]ETH72795.1 tripartite tricarboxylate transporter family receptor [Bordetella pertussis STO1-CHLA-0011]ETH81903.1 tripartite tricarbox
MCIQIAARTSRLLRRLLFSLSAPLLLGAWAPTAMAADVAWPGLKPVTLIVGYPAGGGADTVARLVADRLGKKYNQRFIVENRSGASGTIAATVVARAPADGYTLLASASSELTVVPTIRTSLQYDPAKDFEPVAVTSQTTYLLVSNLEFPANTLQELVAYAKKNPGKVSYGSYGQNTFTHLTGEYLQLLTGTKLLHVPYKGGGDLIPALLGNQIEISFNSPAEVLSQVQAGRMKALAVLSPQRLKEMPSLPTSAKAGYPDLTARGWNGLMAPKGTPTQVLDELNAAVNEIMCSEDVVRDLQARGIEPGGGTRQAARERIDNELQRWRDVVEKVGLQRID